MTRGNDFTDGGVNSVGARLGAYVALAGMAAAGAAIALRRRKQLRDLKAEPSAGPPAAGSALDDADQVGRAGVA